MLALSSSAELLQALARAARIDVEAYTLSGPVLRAVETAARRGAHVAVHLEETPYNAGHLATENRKVASQLRRAGANAALEHPLHAKEIVTDGTLYLDEKNWRPGDLILRDDDAADASTIPQIKHEALEYERRLLDGARRDDEVIVESESFGCCNAVYSELKTMGADAPRLLVCERELRGNRRELAILEALTAKGVRVRVCSDSEKLAVAGDRAWLGSANATLAAPAADGPDWGLCTGDADIVRAVRARLESEWRRAHELAPATSN
ncbi:MAG: hypothetical protein JOZ77_06150 [Candidatus Eremiobacteraeota bacterium]|nr:hypothetical protein [Candidatus Eremiobacteraeota bacterium]